MRRILKDQQRGIKICGAYAYAYDFPCDMKEAMYDPYKSYAYKGAKDNLYMTYVSGKNDKKCMPSRFLSPLLGLNYHKK